MKIIIILSEIIVNLNNELSNKGYIACNSHSIEQYSRKHQVEKLAEIINAI